ncbi:hypothetical protein OG978_33800 [Streptomyces sp. NBC_01591]|uniref:hypothetical protein n=1 Tax=Streptomyces sp. NBC_01591 TaxID=2975888 RepID=UPI002DDAD162|nr:hypothetical protein [Streptomyces sp. NBC_01591]WSD71937.1 hypothetical protein OG978_33800 [Streptomyces sp. NBC_01591]
MDVSDVQQRVQAIADVVADYERAHGLEDDLFTEAITEIANISTDPRARALAGAALQSREIDFQRLAA